MNLKEDNSSAVEKADSGKKFRLVVRSAEEAVRVIRDKLGENAKVLSVRQVGGTGLKRFVSSPKLEVIAHVPEEESQVDQVEVNELDNKVLNADGAPVSSDVKAAPVQDELPEKTETNLATEEIEQGKGLYLLERTGFDQGLLKSLQSWSNWHEISNLPLAEALKEITIGLSDRFRGIQISPTTNKIAFVGSPGSGKFVKSSVLLTDVNPSLRGKASFILANWRIVKHKPLPEQSFGHVLDWQAVPANPGKHWHVPVNLSQNPALEHSFSEWASVTEVGMSLWAFPNGHVRSVQKASPPQPGSHLQFANGLPGPPFCSHLPWPLQ